MRQALLPAAVVPLFMLGCATAGEGSAQAMDLDAERALLLDKDRAEAKAYVASATPLDTTMAAFADDARVLAPGIPMAEGWEASRAVFAELEDLPGYSLAWNPVLADVAASADLGYTIGTYRMTVPDGNGNVVRVDGKYLSLWKRQPDGSWKIAVDMFNASGPPVPATE